MGNLLQIFNKCKKWRLAQTAYNKYGVYILTCDYCSKRQSTYDLKVYHNKYGEKYSRLTGENNYFLTDHMIICLTCSSKLEEGWFPCRCNYLT